MVSSRGLLFLLKTACAGRWLVLAPGIRSLALAYTILFRQQGLKRIAVVFPGRFVAALIEYAFQLRMLGAVSLCGGFMIILGFLGFPLAVFKAYLKFRHTSELAGAPCIAHSPSTSSW
jgi:hypothetical protein